MIYVIVAILFVLILVLMAIGVMFKRPPIQGSCGGLSQVGVTRVCNCKTSCQTPHIYQIQEPTDKCR